MTLTEFEEELEKVRANPYRWEEKGSWNKSAEFCGFIDAMIAFISEKTVQADGYAHGEPFDIMFARDGVTYVMQWKI